MKRRKGASAPAPVSVPEAPPLAARTRWLCAAGVFVVVLAVYQATMLRTVVDIDSGELVAAVHVQGIPHPTGYPLWLLLGRLFDLLPLGHSTAYRVGMMNAVGVAAASGVITLLALELTGQVLPAIFAGLAFGFWSPPWGDSVRAMVHALSGLLAALAMVAFRRWDRLRSRRALYLFALAAGVAAMHHRMAFLVIGPALATAFVLTRPRRARIYLAAAGLALAPFSLYGYLWYRALQHPAVYWTDVTTFPLLFRHAMAEQYTWLAFEHAGQQAFDEIQKMVPQLLAGPGALSVVMLTVGLGLIVWGWSVWYKKERLVAGALAVGTVVVLLWVSAWGEASDLKHFLSPIGPPLALAGALGAAQLRSLKAVKQAPWAPAALAGVLICGGLLSANLSEYDFSNRWGSRDRWAAVLMQMEPNAIFLSDYDQPTFVPIYLQNVEKLRPDITLLRATRLDDKGYLNLLRDPDVRQAALAIGAPSGFTSEQAQHQYAARFAYQLAKRLPNRAVYAVHAPIGEVLPRPPYFINESMDFVRITSHPEEPLRTDSGPVLADFSGIAGLTSFALDKTEAGTGELVHFTAHWRMTTSPGPYQFMLALLPPGVTDPAALASAIKNDDTRLFQPFLLCYGQVDWPAPPPGTAYEQRGAVLIPSNAPPGEYHVAIGLTLPYQEDPTSVRGWTTLPVTVQVKARPLPANGP